MMEFVNGKDDIPYMKWKIIQMFETTNHYQQRNLSVSTFSTFAPIGLKTEDHHVRRAECWHIDHGLLKFHEPLLTLWNPVQNLHAILHTTTWDSKIVMYIYIYSVYIYIYCIYWFQDHRLPVSAPFLCVILTHQDATSTSIYHLSVKKCLLNVCVYIYSIYCVCI